MRDSYFRICRKSAERKWPPVSPLHHVRLEMWSRDLYTIHRIDLRSGIATLESVEQVGIPAQHLNQ